MYMLVVTQTRASTNFPACQRGVNFECLRRCTHGRRDEKNDKLKNPYSTPKIWARNSTDSEP